MKKKWHRKLFQLLIMAALGLLFVTPLFFMVITALKRPEDLATYPITIMPTLYQWHHFKELIFTNGVIYFWRALANSTTLTLVQTAIVAISSALAGFGFARYRARGKNFFFSLLLATMMLPALVTMIPQYIIFSQLGVIGRPWPLAFLPMWLPSLAGWPFFIFLYRQFFATLPKELEDAALIDGCGRLRTFWRIFMPMAGPAITTACILVFQWTYTEYTGPVLLDPAPRRTGGAAGLRNGEAFDRAFHRFCQDEGIIAEFAHLHPFHGARSFLDPGSLVFDRQIVYVDLTFSLDSLWAGSFSHACRKNIRRAQQENLRVYPAHREDQIVEFHRIYTQTMEKNQAASQYFFPLEYFLAFFYVMAESAIFMLAEHRDQIVAGTLYLHDDWDIYSYLGGADQTFQQVRPTNMVVYETILWGQRHGKRRLILGGGYRPDDGIFRFKSSFSPLRADFYTYRRVHDPAAYGSLCAAWSSHYGILLEQENGTQGYFPRYRAVPGEVTQTGSTQK